MKIIQLLPADHWYAEYNNPNGIDHYSKVVCFGLIEWTDTEYAFWSEKDVILSEIEGFSTYDGVIEWNKQHNNFNKYVYSPVKNLEFENFELEDI